MKCRECGAELAANAAICQQCGARVAPPRSVAASQTPPSAPGASGPTVSFPGKPITTTQLDEPDQDLWQGGYSAKAMSGPIIGGALATLAALIAAVALSDRMVWAIALGIVVIVWLGLAFMYAKERLGVRYRLTTQRFFHEHGILRRITDRIEVIAIDDITVEQGLVERMLGVGTIQITSNDRTNPVFLLNGIDEVQQVANIIDEARRAERNRRSVRMESI